MSIPEPVRDTLEVVGYLTAVTLILGAGWKLSWPLMCLGLALYGVLMTYAALTAPLLDEQGDSDV